MRMNINHPTFGAEVHPAPVKEATRVEKVRRPLFLSTPLVENAGFVSLSLVFWLRDFVDRVALFLKKAFGQLLSVTYFVGSLLDPLFSQRWGTEARVQSLYWSGSCFPMQNHKYQSHVHSPAPTSDLWERAFELSFNKSPEYGATCCSSARTLNTLDSKCYNSLKPCFEEAQNLPSFDNGLASIKAIKSPAIKSPSTAKTTIKLATKRRNEESRKRMQQRKIFAKWSKMKFKRSKPELKKKKSKGKTSSEKIDADHNSQQQRDNEEVREPECEESEVPEKSDVIPVEQPVQTDEQNAKVDFGGEPEPVLTELTAIEEAGRLVLDELPRPFETELLPPEPQAPKKASPSKRQRLRNVFKHSEE